MQVHEKNFEDAVDHVHKRTFGIVFMVASLHLYKDCSVEIMFKDSTNQKQPFKGVL